jgi:hypothetical protein
MPNAVSILHFYLKLLFSTKIYKLAHSFCSCFWPFPYTYSCTHLCFSVFALAPAQLNFAQLAAAYAAVPDHPQHDSILPVSFTLSLLFYDN